MEILMVLKELKEEGQENIKEVLSLFFLLITKKKLKQ